MLVECPWCGISIEIIEKNCGIFRCGISKSTYAQIPPHEKEQICKELKEKDLIYGCGNPFKIAGNGVEKCGYI